MAKVLYLLLTFVESSLAVFGIRSAFETPAYHVVARLADAVEIRRYGTLTAAETPVTTDDSQAFSRLFRYISGANVGDKTIAMTTPVEMRGTPRFSGARAQTSDRAGPSLMRFFLPKAMAADPPPPTDPLVRITRLPPRTVAVLRFSGRLERSNIERHEAALRHVLTKNGYKIEGASYVMGYDPPFTIPFLRRNEVAFDIDT